MRLQPVRCVLLSALGLGFSALAAVEPHNYAEALQKALYFYEFQEAGELSPGNRVEWRGNSTLRDGSDVGRDLTGGWYDAGDTVKWTGNDAYGAAMLAWAVVKHPNAFRASHQYRRALANLRHGTDYLLRLIDRDSPTGFRIYVGVGSISDSTTDPANPHDHSPITSLNEWKDVPATVRVVNGVRQPGSVRPSYWVDDATPGGSDVAGHLTAALSVSAIAFRASGDETYANTLLAAARDCEVWSRSHRQVSTATRRLVNGAVVDLSTYSSRGDKPFAHLLWGYAWLARAERDAGNQAAADAAHARALALYEENPFGTRGETWQGQSSGTPQMGAYVLLAADTGEPTWVTKANDYTNFWLYRRSGQTGLDTDITTTPGGFICRGKTEHWNMLQLMETMPVVAEWGDSGNNPSAQQRADCIAYATSTYTVAGNAYPVCPVRQVDYMLGSNPMQISYLVGYAQGTAVWPRNLHYSQTWGLFGGFGTPAAQQPLWNTQIMYGALVPGPNKEDYYPINKTIPEGTTLAYQEPVIYAGGHLSALARMIETYGQESGQPLQVFPQWLPADADERRERYFVRAYRRSDHTAQNSVRVVAYLHSRSFIEPQERNELGFRVYCGIDAGGDNDLTITNLWGANNIAWTGPHADGHGNVYFDIRFHDDYIGPGEWGNYKRNVEFIIGSKSNQWDATNDHSIAALGAEDNLHEATVTVDALPVYDYSGAQPVLLGGVEPSAGYVRFRRAVFNNTWEGAPTIDIIAERIGGGQGAVSATLQCTNGSALVDQDFQPPADPVLTWAANERGSKTCSIPLIHDDLPEGLESFTVALTALSGGLQAGDRVSARVDIEDDDQLPVPKRRIAIRAESAGPVEWTTNSPSTRTVEGQQTYIFDDLPSNRATTLIANGGVDGNG